VILDAGATAPDFELPDQFGAPQRLAARRGVRPVVLVFVPFAFSRTCTGELRELDANAELFADAGAEVLVASVDAKYALRAWAEAEGVGLTLLSDFWPHGGVAARYGAFDESAGFARRATFVIDVEGVIRSSFATGPGEPRPLSAYRHALGRLGSR
jgi:peroxiredoxin